MNLLKLLHSWLLWPLRLSIIMENEAPDTSGLNASAVQNADIARRQQDLAEQEAVRARARQDAFDPKFSAMIDAALKSQTTQDERSAQQWQQYLSNMGAENELYRRSLDYDTAGRRDEAAAAARAGVDARIKAAADETNRALGRSGLSMTAGRAAAADRATRLAGAKLVASADRAARTQVEATGLSLLDNMTKTNRGLASTGLQAAGLALNAGQTGAGGLGQQQATYNASLAPTGSFYNGASGAASASGNTYGQIAGIQQQSQSQGLAGLAGLGSLAGTLLTAPTGGTLLGSMIAASSKDFKTPTGKVGGKSARRTLEGATNKDGSLDRWRYKEGIGDSGAEEHVGRYAESIPGGPMGGKAIDVVCELGLHHAAIADLSREVKQLNRRLSLADAATSGA